MTPDLWKSVTRFDRARIHPWMAVRNALGVGLPLAAGAAFGNAGGGLIMGIGALNVSFSDGSDSFAHRARRMLAATLCCALAVYVGGLTGKYHALAIEDAAVCAFIAGILVAVSTTAADIGNVTLITLVVFSAQSMSPGRALISGLLALGGGLLETALALVFWPVRRHAPERETLAAAYTELARIAAAIAPASQAPPATLQISAAQTAIQALSGDRSLEAERYLALFSQAERIRLALLMLSGLRARLGDDAPELNRVLSLSSEILRDVGLSLASGRQPETGADSVSQLRELGEQLRRRESPPALRDARWQVEALAGQLRSALDLAGHVTPAGAVAFERQQAQQPWRLRLGSAIAMMRANLRPESAAFRHAVRLAACVVLGMVAGHWLGWRRSYWMPMTIAIVLRPDFTSTFSRGVLRLGGTFAGLLVTTAFFHVLAPGLGVEVALVTLCAFAIRCYGPANYGVLVTALTALVVLMFSFTGVAPAQVMLARALNTAAGGAIALLAYWLWPTWERTQISETLAVMLDRYRDYFRAVSDSYLDTSASMAARLDRTRMAARLGRSNLEAAATRLRSEPGSDPASVTALDAIMANSHRFIHAAMSLEAGLLRSRPAPARPGFRVLADHIDLTLYYLTASLRASKIAPADLPDLREAHHTLAGSGTPGVERYALVDAETDRMTNSLNTLAEEILAW
ncbi:MAG TPA: FUSC family protein [Bryobacteraceae bacterium]|jgi:uncharacterized membrane protein YccC|nr:FUSC family protein [Bryobacteraceae bacterium]